jgi:glycosyltransferase involved in cell wall biosynthesis
LARVLYFSRDYTPHDHRFLAALAGSDHQIYYLKLERRGIQLEDRPVPFGVETIAWAGGDKPAQFIDNLWLLSSLRGVIRRVEPGLIHAGPIQSCAFLSALTGFRPLVSMSWGYDLLRDASRTSLMRWATRFALRRSNVMIGDCKVVRDAAIQFGMAADRILTFPWGVDLKKFTPDGIASRDPEEFILLSTRSWEPIYGVDIIARAFVIAARRLPELRLILLGSGSQAGLIRSTFIQGGVSERVDFRGPVNQADLPDYYRLADLYISASHVDGSSVSLMEALACGIPALVSDIPGNREWVEQGRSGWFFPDGDVDALAEGILNVVALRRDLPEIGLAARKRAEQKANWDINRLELFRAYELALNDN